MEEIAESAKTIDPTKYVKRALGRQRRRKESLDARRERAWEVARLGAETLKGEFGAARVAAFGSLVQANLFHERSDIDLCVWGLAERLYFKAVGRLQSLDPDYAVDLVHFETAKPDLKARVEREGETL